MNEINISQNDLRKIWEIDLELLDEFDRICKLLNLPYFLDSGSLLGAVREKGFIPWDDDIDIVMMREDYDKLIVNAPKLTKEDYFFQCAYTDVDYYRGHAQLRKNNTMAMIPSEAQNVKFHQGIFIDVFPLDGVPDKEEDVDALFAEKEKLWDHMYKIAYPFSEERWKRPLKVLRSKIFRLIYGNPLDIYKRYDKCCAKNKDTVFVEKVMQRHQRDELYRIKRSWYSNCLYLQFEDRTCPIPEGYDSILRSIYGDDYMIPKKVSTSHGELILSSDVSYKDFKNL